MKTSEWILIAIQCNKQLGKFIKYMLTYFAVQVQHLTYWWCQKSSGIVKNQFEVLGTLNICTKCHGDVFQSFVGT